MLGFWIGGRHLEKQWQDHNTLSQQAHETLEERRRELATTLKNMMIRLQSNFDAMRKAMNWNAEAESGTLDEAGIQIRAVIHSESQTEALLSEIVEMIESDEQHREREIEAGRSDIIPSQEKYDETLKEKINQSIIHPRSVIGHLRGRLAWTSPFRTL